MLPRMRWRCKFCWCAPNSGVILPGAFREGLGLLGVELSTQNLPIPNKIPCRDQAGNLHQCAIGVRKAKTNSTSGTRLSGVMKQLVAVIQGMSWIQWFGLHYWLFVLCCRW